MNKLRWGIMGTGNIAAQFAAGVASSKRSVIAAVGSRAPHTAQAFGKRFAIQRCHGNYEALLADDQVDAIYLSLPNALHCQWTIRALESGKHVLCEKPLASNLAQAVLMFDAADRMGRVLVEAFMYRAHPLTQAYMKEIRQGAIGELRLLRCSFNYCTRRVEGNVRFSPDLHGGSLMDIGTYCTSLAILAADGAMPTTVRAAGHKHDTGVDDQAAGVLMFDSGMIASFTCGMTAHSNNAAYFCGTDGLIEVPWPWKPPEPVSQYSLRTMTAPRQDQAPTSPTQVTREVSIEVPLYGHEADAFADVVFDGAQPFMPREHSLTNQRLLDELRKQVGLGF